MLSPLAANLSPLGTAAAVFSPDRIAGLAVWLKADALTGLADGDPVSAWPDASGNGNAAAGAGAARPAYKVNILNGLPVVRFGGSHVLQTAAFSARLPQPTTVFIVAGMSAAVATQVFYDGLSLNYRHHLYKYAGDLYQLASPGQYAVASPFSAGGVGVVSSVFDGAASDTRRNAAALGAGTTGTADLDGLTVGNNYPGTAGLVGDVAEVLVYAAALSAADRAAVENYLLTRYGI